MAIEAIEGKGVNRARVVCDDCQREEVATCDYERIGTVWKPNEGQVVRKMEGAKWALVKGTLRCPTCEAKRKVKMQETAVAIKAKAKAEVPRDMTPKQKREIIGLLEIVYDDDEKRFKAGESDKTVAEAIGGGCMWGWVAQVREELFGPDTRSEEVEGIRKSLSQVEKDFLDQAKKFTDAIAALKLAEGQIRADLDSIRDRLAKVA